VNGVHNSISVLVGSADEWLGPLAPTGAWTMHLGLQLLYPPCGPRVVGYRERDRLEPDVQDREFGDTGNGST